MVHRGSSPRRLMGALAAALLCATLLGYGMADHADAGVKRCERHRVDAADRARTVTGSGERIVVIGDSWSVGLGLDDLAGSWPSRLDGEVHVAGFSGSGFSAWASGCGRVSFADRAADAVAGGADVVVVEGGLNDFDQPNAATDAGFRRLMEVLAGQRVVVVGPVPAPAREGAVRRVDLLLAELSTEYRVPYVTTTDLDLAYLGDGLHLTEGGHREFGDAVAERLATLTPSRPRPM
ncbi:MAG: SGNH/GDSL hydrolase family protein [Nocardioides sp.]|nr:SGNH/GDSL hydrolase family protein [Nocardioides sp.]